MKPLAAAALLALAACAAPDDPRVGRWDLHQVRQAGADVTAEHDPQDERFIELLPDGRFQSGGAPHGPNTGRWSVDAETGELWIDSDAGESDDSYWMPTLHGDTMVWRGTRGFGQQFTLVHVRAED